MAKCHSTTTPVDTRAKLSATDGDPVEDASQYRSLAGALQYLMLTRPDIAYAVQQVCLFMHDPREPHLAMIKRILRYVKGTLSTGLHVSTGPVDSLTAYFDADWAGCPNSWRSTSVSSSATVWWLGLPNVKPQSLVRAQRLSIVLSHMLRLSLASFVSCYRSSMRPCLRRR